MKDMNKKRAGGAAAQPGIGGEPIADEKNLIKREQGEMKKMNLQNYLKLCINSVEQFPAQHILNRTPYERLLFSMPDTI